MNKNHDVIIIGAGPAGLFSAISIRNKNILVIEKNPQPGNKFLLSGLGQCNYTNSCEIDEFLKRYGDKSRFIKNALYNFSNTDAINFLKQEGLESIIRKDNKVFPSTFKAQDIVNILMKRCKSDGVGFLYNTSVNSVIYDKENKKFTINCNDKSFSCSFLIIATGGKSYEHTGSTGDGYILAKSLGHTIERLSPALTPVYVKDYSFKELSGVSFKNVKMSVWRDNKKRNEFLGDLLFTHKNISGPLIINNSRYIEKDDVLRFNFTKYKNHEDFKGYFKEKISYGNKLLVKTVVGELNLPKRFKDKILELAQLSEGMNCSELQKDKRDKLIELLSNYPMKVEKLGDYNVAMVTKGGISTKEINHKTMESKIIKNLYFAGEVIDIDGETGGYNIQAAFSTGKLAGQNIL